MKYPHRIICVAFWGWSLMAQATEFPKNERPEWCDETIDWHVLEAEELANGASWQVRDHVESWYRGIPLGEKMLTGAENISSGGENRPVMARFEIRNTGTHTLWIRLLATRPQHSGKFTITIRQAGKNKVVEEVDCARIKSGDSAMQWDWVPFPCELDVGTVEIELSRPDAGSSWLGRNIDTLLLTNAPGYTPDLYDILPRIYLRWINEEPEMEPFCWYGRVHRMARPWYARMGIWDAAGFSGTYNVPRDRQKWLPVTEASEWVDLSPYLLPEGAYNRVQLLATRTSLQEGWVMERIKGRLEVAVGKERKLAHTIPVDQIGPRLLFAVSGDMSRPDARVRSARDFARESRVTAAKGVREGKRAHHLDLNAHFKLSLNEDDRQLIEDEILILKNLGFNGIYEIPAPKGGREILEWYRSNELELNFGLPRSGAWFMVKDGDYTQPDMEKMEAVFRERAEGFSEIMEHAVRINVGDEPAGESWDSLEKNPAVREAFVAYLQEENVPLETLGVKDWSEVVITPFLNREKHPALYYYSSLYRLKRAADLAKQVVAAKKRHLPDSVKTYVNYAPLFSWTARGMDPFMTQRDGGFEMGWSEDWLGYNAGPQSTSDTYALLRAAGRGQPLGGYMVGVSGNALMQRIKYYATVAGGARQINVYSYGPAYISMDSWSENLEIYPVIQAIQHELGHIDAALKDTERRTSPVAILYNRTAAIWAGGDDNATAELDARFLRWALSHAGYDAEIIPEEDIIAGGLGRFKALYISGIELRRDAAEKIAEWVNAGGTLIGSAGAGTRDELNQTMNVLEPVFGSRSRGVKKIEEVGRPNYELRNRRILNQIFPKTGNSTNGFRQLCYRESLDALEGADVIAEGRSGEVMGVRHQYGKGTAWRVAALMGLAYLNSAIHAPDYPFKKQLPQDYDRSLRDFIIAPLQAAGIPPIATNNLRASEVVRYDKKGSSAVFVINYEGNQQEDFSFLLPDADWVKQAYTADGASVSFQHEKDGSLQIRFPLNIAGAVMLEGDSK